MMDYTFKKVILPVVLVCFYWSIIASSLRQMNSVAHMERNYLSLLVSMMCHHTIKGV